VSTPFLEGPNEPYRARRLAARRRRARRRLALALVALVALAGFLAGALLGAGDDDATTSSRPATTGKVAAATKKRTGLRPLPDEVRGVHVTVALASIPGKIRDYLDLPGLNTLEVDVKDENGELGFVPSSVPLAREIGAAKRYYAPRRVARAAHAAGVYLIGRVVVFEDPILSEARPALAIRTRDGGVWRNDAGLGWTNPYDKRVWDYNVGVGVAAARAGFDEIQFDYIRFPSDGAIESAVFPGAKGEPGWTTARFVHYAAKRLRAEGVRVSVDVFGLSAARDLGIGQFPGRLAKLVDAVYPMVYPSHYNAGEYGLADPVGVPGATVARSLADFRKRMRGTKAQLIPWLEDFSFSGEVSPDHVRAQITAARRQGARGYLLWNPLGEYTEGALAPQAGSE
jgi:Putative glycosyl hydrolase domain